MAAQFPEGTANDFRAQRGLADGVAHARDPATLRPSNVLGCGGMLRLPAYFVITALLATPLALLARGIACNPSDCNCMALCARQAAAHSEHLCGAARLAPMCGTHRSNHAIDYGFIAPIPPTAPIPRARLAELAVSNDFVTPEAQSAIAGSLSVPFHPPRS